MFIDVVTIVNDIINKHISSINRSLPATPMTGIHSSCPTTLKNKIKLLELESKLLKDNIINKQKFTDTLLQHNSKLSQNFDISSIITVSNEARKQPHKRQHYEKNDTWLNNRQKQEENKSSEKSNEKMLVTKKKIDHQKKLVYQQTEVIKIFTS